MDDFNFVTANFHRAFHTLGLSQLTNTVQLVPFLKVESAYNPRAWHKANRLLLPQRKMLLWGHSHFFKKHRTLFCQKGPDTTIFAYT